MMDTVLNLGLNAQTLEGLTELTGDPRFSRDSYRRFVQGFGAIVLNLDSRAFRRHHSRTQGTPREVRGPQTDLGRMGGS